MKKASEICIKFNRNLEFIPKGLTFINFLLVSVNDHWNIRRFYFHVALQVARLIIANSDTAGMEMKSKRLKWNVKHCLVYVYIYMTRL